MNRSTLLWTLVAFFGASLVFATLRRVTEDSPVGVTVAAQLVALALMVVAIVLVMRRRG